MNNKEKLYLLIIAIVMLLICVFVGNKLMRDNAKEFEQVLPQEEILRPVDHSKAKNVTVFFIGQNSNGDEVYKTVKREYIQNEEVSELEFLVQALINGPTDYEKSHGIYSEVPQNTRVISVYEQPNKIILDLDYEFESGGGTDSSYKKLYQLIKTMKANVKVPVYLYIDGEQAEFIGGEGIMITQPLDESSLEG